MIIDYIDFKDIPQLSDRDKAYQSGNSKLKPFYPYAFEFSEFEKIISDRSRQAIDRELLVSELKSDYEHIAHSKKVANNIEKLQNSNCFTVITAHQPSLFTGPFYYIIKIASTLNLAKKLNEAFPNNHIVPVFILGAEDHDFDEINHSYLYNKKVTWEREASGAVGRLSKEGLEDTIKTVAQILGESENAKTLHSKIDMAYQNSSNYGEFSFMLTHLLFDQYGLVIANFDNKSFKKAFTPLIKREVKEQFSKSHIVSTQNQLLESGFSDQAFARDINFFYLHKNKRSRIELKENRYYILDTDISFNLDEIMTEIEEHPDRFSPNVIMRPLYQESIMPNLAYIGGGGELAYWMERKSQFKDAQVFFPMLIRRNSVLWINSRNGKQLDALSLGINDLMKNTDLLIKEYALQESSHDVDFSDAYSKLEEAYSQIKDVSSSIDGSLGQKIDAMKTSTINGLDKLQGRLIKGIKQNQEVKLNKVRKIQDSLFPGGSLQERKTNFMELYLPIGNQLIDTLIEHCDPFEKRFLIFREE